MRKWMIDSIIEAPETCRYLFHNRQQYAYKLAELFLKKEYKEIVMVASGSSYNIAQCARYAIENYLGVRVSCVSPVTFSKYGYRFYEDPLILCLSQSGRSTNTIEAVKKAKELGYDVAAISMRPESPITQYCENILEYGTYAPGDDVFVCRGVPSSTLYFILFALEAGRRKGFYPEEKYQMRMAEIETLIERMPEIRKKSEAFYHLNKEEFYAMKRVMTIGTGPGLGVAMEGALKIEETIGIASNAYETEEFLHGPAYEVKKDHALFIVDIDDTMHTRHMQVFEASKELTDKVYLITKSKEIKGKNIIHISDEICPYILPVLFVIVFQFIASSVCDDLRVAAITIYNHRFSEKIKTKA